MMTSFINKPEELNATSKKERKSEHKSLPIQSKHMLCCIKKTCCDGMK